MKNFYDRREAAARKAKRKSSWPRVDGDVASCFMTNTLGAAPVGQTKWFYGQCRPRVSYIIIMQRNKSSK